MSITLKKQKKKSGKGLSHAMTLNNAIDYVHWDDLELNRSLRLLDTSHRAGNNAQWMLSMTTNAIDHWRTSRNRSYYKLNHIDKTSQLSGVSEKKYFCQYITHRIMKKRSSEKRKISFERYRLVEKLHAPARRNFPRRRVIVWGWRSVVDIVEMRPCSSFNSVQEATIYSSICWASTRVPYRSRARVEARRLMLSLR